MYLRCPNAIVAILPVQGPELQMFYILKFTGKVEGGGIHLSNTAKLQVNPSFKFTGHCPVPLYHIAISMYF